MKKQIQIYTDYVCPYCLLADHVINKVIQGLDVEIKWRPFELRPAPVPTLRTEDRYLPEIWERSVYPMAAKLGVALKLPEISPQPRTDKAFQVFALAEQVGLGDEFSVAVMKAFSNRKEILVSQMFLPILPARLAWREMRFLKLYQMEPT
ncbi:DsbA family protein [Vibrio coralliilyticus]